MTATRLSFITACKGRLEHLKQTLPRMAAESDSECIVVDYDCPDGTADWTRAHFPDVRVVQVGEAPRFHKAHAQNLGATAATSEWLVFIDADILIEAGFSAALRPLLQRRHFLRPAPITPETWGTFACHRGDFFAIEGYDEALEGYGGEDSDLFLRLAHSGRSVGHFDGPLIRAISHGDDWRIAHHEVKDIELNRRINSLYNHVKHDLIRESGQINLPFDARRTIYAEVRKTLLESAQRGAVSSVITIDLPPRLRLPLTAGWTIRRRWTFEIAPTEGKCEVSP